jgi:mannosyl-glycoprotein endo-beta-N-acetylglucosaminidase
MSKNITKYLLVASGAIFTLLLFTKKKIKQATKKTMFNPAQIEFVKFLTPYAKAIGQKIGVPYIFLISQIILETSWGKSSLFKKYFNVGGIKAVRGQKSVSLMTYEYENGIKVQKPQNFAVYSDLLSGLNAYAKIFQNRYFKMHLNKTTNPDTYVTLLQSSKIKYATDINYIDKIKKLNSAVSQYA